MQPDGRFPGAKGYSIIRRGGWYYGDPPAQQPSGQPVPVSRRQRFWRWLKAPRLSIADGFLYVTLTLFADALKLSSGWPWPIVLVAVLAFTGAFMFLAGFLKGFSRSARGHRR